MPIFASIFSFLAINDGAVVIPRLENRRDGCFQLLHRVGREVASGLFFEEGFVLLAKVFPVVGGKFGVFAFAQLFFLRGQQMLEAFFGQTGIIALHGDVGKHHQEAAVRVISEARVAAAFDQSVQRFVVQAEVQNRVHHARHRELGAAADGKQKRVFRVAELLADFFFHIGDGGFHVVHQAGGKLAIVIVIRGADFGGDGESGRNRQPDVGHFGEVGAFATQQIFQVFVAFAEQPDGLLLHASFAHDVFFLRECCSFTG